MLKTISAALIAASMIAAPAFAATAGKTTAATVVRSEPSKSKLMNANARMGRLHQKHVRHHSQHHHKIGALKTSASPKLATKPAAHTGTHTGKRA